MNQSRADYSKVVVPISSLGRFSDRWTIRARVTHKSSIHPKDGLYMFSVELRDESAEINAMVMSNRCCKWVGFYEKIQLNKVYYISGVKDLQRTNKDTAIDIIGIGECTEKSDDCFEPPYTGQEARRTIWITDHTGRVQLTLYGDQVERFNGRHAAVVAVKGARLGVSDELSLHMCRWGHIEVNPDLPAADSLRIAIAPLRMVPPVVKEAESVIAESS
ncbi:replication factor A 1, rfa1, putative [Ixodes scapularis]|uniref:Replication factor A 1, rfa1, putative n=1 Tax=Ixodes scapularis TaxID=6945 RepID=B7QAS3_IXOSC|nr:replication factor A 1, rfa1, putative [Ixodes scapularis]|eukprot:XP_002412649.1 replication factor A 1, rfa1, putative [Ixodes scapularis]